MNYINFFYSYIVYPQVHHKPSNREDQDWSMTLFIAVIQAWRMRRPRDVKKCLVLAPPVALLAAPTVVLPPVDRRAVLQADLQVVAPAVQPVVRPVDHKVVPVDTTMFRGLQVQSLRAFLM